MRVLEQKDIVQLLRREVKKAGSQAAWAKKHGVDRSRVNKALQHASAPTESIILALGLRIVVVSDED
jgi:DNA-binding phage protein